MRRFVAMWSLVDKHLLAKTQDPLYQSSQINYKVSKLDLSIVLKILIRLDNQTKLNTTRQNEAKNLQYQ